MGRLGYCIPCGEGRRDVDATVMVGDDPMCDMHARMLGDGMLTKLPEAVPLSQATTPAKPAGAMCSHGCGRERHRGRCKGAQPLAVLSKYRSGEARQFIDEITSLPALPSAPVTEPGKGSLKVSLAFVRAQHDELEKEEDIALAELRAAQRRFDSVLEKRMRLVPLMEALAAHVEVGPIQPLEVAGIEPKGERA